MQTGLPRLVYSKPSTMPECGWIGSPIEVPRRALSPRKNTFSAHLVPAAAGQQQQELSRPRAVAAWTPSLRSGKTSGLMVTVRLCEPGTLGRYLYCRDVTRAAEGGNDRGLEARSRGEARGFFIAEVAATCDSNASGISFASLSIRYMRCTGDAIDPGCSC